MSDFERTRFYSTRPRRVPPEFCTDDLLEECSVLAALTLYRIISMADDQGRLPGAPTYIRSLCFSRRPEISVATVASAIDQIVRAGFLSRYDYQGRVLLQVDRWHDLQGKWGRRAYGSRYPAPPGWTSDWDRYFGGHDVFFADVSQAWLEHADLVERLASLGDVLSQAGAGATRSRSRTEAEGAVDARVAQRVARLADDARVRAFEIGGDRPRAVAIMERRLLAA
jgi:hypothetical protein